MRRKFKGTKSKTEGKFYSKSIEMCLKTLRDHSGSTARANIFFSFSWHVSVSKHKEMQSPPNLLFFATFLYTHSHKLRKSLINFYPVGNRTKTSVASIPKFERDAAPHEGLSPRPDSAPPRAVTSRPVKERERREPPQRGRRQTATPWSPPIPTGSTWLTTPAAPVRRQLTIDDFYHPPQSVSVPSNSGRTSQSSDDELPTEFTSPPLLPALHN